MNEQNATKALWAIYGLIVVAMAAATLLENNMGSAFVGQYIYNSWWFALLWILLVLSGGSMYIKQRMWDNIPHTLVHASFLLILLGGLFSATTSQSGYMHIIKGENASHFISDKGKKETQYALPFTMSLDSFQIRYYEGTSAPMDYISYLKVDGQPAVISMNKNYKKDGYNFCQSSFDDNGIGTYLSVSHNPYGIAVTYAGFILFIIASLAMLVWPDGTFRTLLSSPALKHWGALSLLLVLSVQNSPLSAADSTARQRPAKIPSKEEARKMQRMQVLYQNRVAPLNTQATDFVKKIYGKANYKHLMPEQVFGGWMIDPEAWRNQEMIYIKNAELRNLLNIEKQHCSLADLFDSDGSYRLKPIWDKERQKTAPTKLLKGILEVDEKVGLLLMQSNNTLLQPIPADGSVTPLSEAKIEAELLYNKLPIDKILFMLNLTLGIAGFAQLVYKTMRDRQKEPHWMPVVQKSMFIIMCLALVAHSFVYALRWYISGRIPLSNGYETMQFLALTIMLISVLLFHRFSFSLPFGFLLSGFTLLVSYLGQMNPQITPLMPVLISPWLSFHVSCIMISYALFAFIFLNSALALVLMRNTTKNGQKTETLTVLNRVLLIPAVFLLGTGIILGAVWANSSWGDYWAWDPKEVWALISFMVYGAALYDNLAPAFRRKKFFHIYLLLAFLTILMTYFGVNYILGGMHSYANS